MTTLCIECSHLIIENPRDAWWRWRCMARPLSQWFNPVTGQTVADPAYAKCRDMNNGQCGMFSAGPNQYNPRGVPE